MALSFVDATEDLIERYQDDIAYLTESEDADDRIVAGVLASVIGDLRRLC